MIFIVTKCKHFGPRAAVRRQRNISRSIGWCRLWIRLRRSFGGTVNAVLCKQAGRGAPVNGESVGEASIGKWLIREAGLRKLAELPWQRLPIPCIWKLEWRAESSADTFSSRIMLPKSDEKQLDGYHDTSASRMSGPLSGAENGRSTLG